ncbi:MAG: HAMP domain-containing sensor histidine kinase [Dehalococcoidia bacterium]
MKTKFFDLPLRFQIIIPFSLLIVALTVVAVSFGLPLASKATSQNVDLKLENARSHFLLLLDHEAAQLDRSAALLAQDADLAAALAGGDRVSLSEALTARAQGPFDALQVMDAQGATLVGARGHAPLPADTLARLGRTASTDYGGSIVSSSAGHMLVVVRPIGPQDDPHGFVATGRLLSRLLPDLRSEMDAELALYVGGRLAASTFTTGHGQAQDLVALPFETATGSGSVTKGSVIDGRSYAATYNRLDIGDGTAVAYAVFVPRSEVWPADMLVASGLAAILIIPLILLVLGFAIARAIASRLERVVTTIERIGDGDFQQRVDLDSSDEVGRLAHVVNRMAARLHEAETSKAEFLAMASHEVRTPLTLIGNASELLLDGSNGAGEGSRRELLEIISGNVERMNRRVADLLVLARMDAGHLSLRTRPADLTPLVVEAAESVRPMLSAKGQSLSLVLPSSLPSVSVDPDRIQQVLLNLLTNASRHTAPGTRVSVRVAHAGDEARVEVEDDGQGMPQEQVQRLLDGQRRPFGRDAGGLGLLIAQRLVALHGGRLWARSEPNRGSLFAFALPYSPEGDEVTNHEDTAGG